MGMGEGRRRGDAGDGIRNGRGGGAGGEGACERKGKGRRKWVQKKVMGELGGGVSGV